MFPLIGILVAAALLFTKRKKAPAVVAVVPTKAATTTTKSPVKSTAKPAPAKVPAKTPAKTSATGLPASSIEGLPLPSGSQYAADLFGSMLGTNPKVLSTSLPYGFYSPNNNNTGTQTPPIVVPTYR